MGYERIPTSSRVLAVGRQVSLRDRFYNLFVGGSSWFDASSYVDAGGGLCSGLVDYIDPTHLLANPLGPSQCANPTTDALLNNQFSLIFSGSQHYISNRTASAWNHHHNGLGLTNIMVFIPTNTSVTQILTSTTGPNPGASLYLSGNNPGMSCVNAAAGVVFNGVDSGGAGPNIPRIYVRRFKTSSTPNWSFSRGSVLKASGSNSSVPSNSAGLSLTLGKTAQLGSPSYMRFRAMYDFNYELTPTQLNLVFEYIYADTGLFA